MKKKHVDVPRDESGHNVNIIDTSSKHISKIQIQYSCSILCATCWLLKIHLMTHVTSNNSSSNKTIV